MKALHRTLQVCMALIVGAFSNSLLPVAVSAYTTQPSPTYPKVWVCKYVGTPGEDETLKNGNDGLVSVNTHAIQGSIAIGAYFNDAQGRSFVVAWDNNNNKPPTSMCPAGDVADVILSPVVSHKVECGPNNDIITWNEGEWTVVDGGWSGNTRVITWTAKAGFTFAGSKTHTKTFTDQNTKCPDQTAAAPQVNHEVVCGPNNDIITWSEGHYTMTSDSGWVDGTRTIKWTAVEGYTFTEGKVHTKIFTDNATNCKIANPMTDHEIICGANNDVTTHRGGNYTVKSESNWVNGQKTIVYVANAGFTFEEGLTHTKTFTDNNTVCPPELTQTPELTYSEVCGANNDTITWDEGNYSLVSDSGWVMNERELIFKADAGYTFGEEQNYYAVTLIDSAEACPVNGGAVLGDSTVNPIITPKPVTLSATTSVPSVLPATGGENHGLLLVGLAASALTYYAVLRRTQ